MRDIRRKQIVDILNDNGSVVIADLASKFDTSEMTIHRDLDYLESKGILTKRRGGAVANNFSETFQNRSTKNLEQKQYIAKKVYDLIEEYDTIMIDGGTTSLEVARLLKNGKNLTVFTTSILTLNILHDAPNISLYCLGSWYAREMVHFVGGDVEQQIENLNFSKCVFGTAGISEDLYVYDPYPQLGAAKRKMMESSSVSILAVDSGKFGKVAVQRFAHTDDFSYIVTDADIPEAYKEQLDKDGKLIY